MTCSEAIVYHHPQPTSAIMTSYFVCDPPFNIHFSTSWFSHSALRAACQTRTLEQEIKTQSATAQIHSFFSLRPLSPPVICGKGPEDVRTRVSEVMLSYLGHCLGSKINNFSKIPHVQLNIMLTKISLHSQVLCAVTVHYRNSKSAKAVVHMYKTNTISKRSRTYNMKLTTTMVFLNFRP